MVNRRPKPDYSSLGAGQALSFPGGCLWMSQVGQAGDDAISPCFFRRSVRSLTGSINGNLAGWFDIIRSEPTS